MPHLDVASHTLNRELVLTIAHALAWCAGVLCVSSVSVLQAQPATEPPAAPATGTPLLTYGENGLEFRTADDAFRAVVGFRNQLRFTSPFVDVPADASDIPELRVDDFRLNRSRVRLEGHAFTPRLEYTMQIDFVEERMRDLNATYILAPWARLRAGRWKVEMSRERVASSGAQQLVDRSIVDRWFTFGRQQGVEMFGTLAATRPWSGAYWVGAFRGVDERGGPLLPTLLGRYQWNLAGRDVPFEEGDPDGSRELLLAIALGASRKESTYTRFLGSGVGDQLPGLPPGDSRYLLRQYTSDLSLKWRGLSVQAEYHRRHVRGLSTGVDRELTGGYVQGGVLASSIWRRAPRSLELSARVAIVDPDLAIDDDSQREDIVGGNWYFQGHRNKISVDVSRLQFASPTGPRTADLRTRVQWDVTF
jgi:phosphate-selective porin OprO/OprP